ncbi:MAG: helix-turn-helix domain-containing protein [Chloroflexi bacterium]|nr:helix-turn-helix domain-containing protein [Chloroflexota bacterium]
MALVGDYLRHARETRGLAPLQIEIDTRIRANIIEALEAGDFSQLPPEPFLRGLIRTYAAYLGADSQEALRLLISDLTAPPKPKPIPQPIAPPPTAR